MFKMMFIRRSLRFGETSVCSSCQDSMKVNVINMTFHTICHFFLQLNKKKLLLLLFCRIRNEGKTQSLTTITDFTTIQSHCDFALQEAQRTVCIYTRNNGTVVKGQMPSL